MPPPTIQLDAINVPSDIIAIINNAPLPGLDSTPKCHETARRIDAILSNPDRTLPETCLAGLWLLAGDLDRSHQLSQSIDHADGAYWHGIMHRREGDFSNAKYWFRRIGTHPVLESMSQWMASHGVSFSEHPARSTSGFSPADLVDACQRVINDDRSSRTFTAYQQLQDICWQEWQQLFADCWKRYNR